MQVIYSLINLLYVLFKRITNVRKEEISSVVVINNLDRLNLIKVCTSTLENFTVIFISAFSKELYFTMTKRTITEKWRNKNVSFTEILFKNYCISCTFAVRNIIYRLNKNSVMTR